MFEFIKIKPTINKKKLNIKNKKESNVNKFIFKIEDKKFSINIKQKEISIYQNDFLEKLISTNLPISLIEYYIQYNLSKSCNNNIFLSSYKF